MITGSRIQCVPCEVTAMSAEFDTLSGIAMNDQELFFF